MGCKGSVRAYRRRGPRQDKETPASHPAGRSGRCLTSSQRYDGPADARPAGSVVQARLAALEAHTLPQLLVLVLANLFPALLDDATHAMLASLELVSIRATPAHKTDNLAMERAGIKPESPAGPIGPHCSPLALPCSHSQSARKPWLSRFVFGASSGPHRSHSLTIISTGTRNSAAGPRHFCSHFRGSALVSRL